MTIKECIDIVDDLKPNQYSTKVKVMWLSFIDEIIINDVLKTHKGYDGRYDDFTGYSEDKLSVPLIVKSPYDRLYTAYLKMKIDAENGETARYNNSASLFNSYLMEYKKFYNKTHMPLSEAEKRAITPVKNTSCGISEADLENLEREIYAKLYEDFSGMVSDDKLYSIVSNYVINNIEMLKENRDVDLAIEGIKTDLKSKADLIDGKVPLSQLAADSIYNPESHNPQSGIAVAEAVEQVNMALSAAVYKGFVAKENGKGLSTNDFTDEDKEKLGSALQADDISDKMDKFGTVELDGTRLGDVTASVKNFQLLNLTGESGLGLGVHEARLHSKEAAILSKLNTETGDSTEVAVGDGIVNLSSGKDDVILNGVATPTDDNHGTNKQYVDEAVAEAVGVANDYTDKSTANLKSDIYNNFAPVIKNTVTGSAIAVNDVSSVEHNLSVQLSSDTVTDFSEVNVSRLGKNLLDTSTFLSGITNMTEIEFEGRNCLLSNLTGDCSYNGYTRFRLTAPAYFISMDIYSPAFAKSCMALRNKDGGLIRYILPSNDITDWRRTIISSTPIYYIEVYFNANSSEDDRIYIDKDSIYASSARETEEIEPYNGQTVTANADGSVDGLTSLSPNMTVVTDTDGVTIDMTYNADTKMYIDNKIAEISAAIVNNS